MFLDAFKYCYLIPIILSNTNNSLADVLMVSIIVNNNIVLFDQ